MHDSGPVAAGCFQRQFQRGGDILGLHRGAELSGDDVTAVIVEDRAEIEPAPSDDIEIGEVRLLELVWACDLVPELVPSLYHHIVWRGDQIFGAENAVHGRFRDEVALLIGVFDRQFPRRQVFVFQRKIDNMLADLVWDVVPD